MALPSHTLVVEDYAEFRELLQAWIDGHYNLMVVLGIGIGKSENIERMMFMASGQPNKQWLYVKGHIPPSVNRHQNLSHFRRQK